MPDISCIGGSSDDTGAVVEELQDKRIRYFKLPQNRGAGGARNYGVLQAQYDMIAFHDSDDEWVEDKMEKQMEYLERYTECGLVYSAYTIQFSDGKRWVVPDLGRWENVEGDIFVSLLLRNTVGAPTIVMKRSVFEEMGGFDEDMRSLEDWDLAIRVAKRYPIGFVPESLVEVRGPEGGVSSAQGEYYKSRCYMLRKYRGEYLETGMFNAAVQNILEMAKRDGILEQVEKMLLLLLSS